MDHLSIFCRLRDRDCLIVGGGDVIKRRARLLSEADIRLTANALAFIPQFKVWVDENMLTLMEGPFDESLLDTCWLTIAATDDDTINRSVSTAAESRHIFYNVVDAPKATSLIVPSIIDCSPLMVAVSSDGTSPVLARLLRERLESVLLQHLGQITQYAGKLRSRVKKQFTSMGERRRFREKLLVNGRLARSLANNDLKAVEETTEQMFSEPLDHRGEVVPVGAGPGDAGLLTLKGLQQIQQTNVVVCDRLVSDDIMNLVCCDTDRVFVSKHAGYHCISQEEIDQILLRKAQQGKHMVRLKGGDPFIFDCGGEELETLCHAGIPFSVVPGITAASGCSAYSGIPLTHRDYARSVRPVTGHLETGGKLDWENLAAEKQTLVFYIGLDQATTIQEKLIESGMQSNVPVALVENGTSVKQRVVDGVLTQLDEPAQQVESPALITVGRMVRLRDKLNWFPNY